MNARGAAEGTIVVLEGDVARSLRKVANRWALTVLQAEAADHAFELIRGAHPRVIIVQVGKVASEALKFIRLAAGATRPVPMIVAATRHSIDLERKILRAGAKCYVPSVASELLEPLLEAILVSEKRR